jgi:hypothetical protein
MIPRLPVAPHRRVLTRATRALVLAAALALLASPAARAGEPDPLAPAYAADLRGADGGFRWTGRMSLSVANPDPVPLTRVWLRLWGNGPHGCGRRAVRVSAVSGATTGTPIVRCTAVPLDLVPALAPGGRATVELDVDIRAPDDFDRFGEGGRRLALFSNALPALAHREGGRWRLDRYFASGEAWTYPAADFLVRLAAPRGVDVAAPGVRQAGGFRRLSRGRDYSWAAGTRLRRLGATGAGGGVTGGGPRRRPRASLSLGGPPRPVGAQMRHTLQRVRKRLPQLVRRYGPYGWDDLQVIITDAAGMEHTALIMTPPDDLVITHELAHEWWYALIGDDQAAAPWLDEGFATYAEWKLRGTALPCRRTGRVGRRMSRGVDFYRSRPFEYGSVYWGGGCLLVRLERRLGEAAFRRALRGYALGLRYGWSTAERFMAAMDAAAAPRRLDDLWRAYRLRS